MSEDIEYRVKRTQLLFEQIKWMIHNHQLGIGLHDLAERLQLGRWEAQHLFQEYLSKDPLRFIQDAFSPSLAQTGEINQVSIFDDFDPDRIERKGILVEIESLDSAEVIYYTKFRYFLGELFMASTERGICQLTFEDAEDGLARLKKTFPKAELLEERVILHESTFEVLNTYFTDRGKILPPVPVAVKATPFQIRVWKELSQLKPGELTTYKTLTEVLGDSNASRAVGAAVGANPVALLIPCHRVIYRSGKLGNFRWQIWRKQTLLAIEK